MSISLTRQLESYQVPDKPSQLRICDLPNHELPQTSSQQNSDPRQGCQQRLRRKPHTPGDPRKEVLHRIHVRLLLRPNKPQAIRTPKIRVCYHLIVEGGGDNLGTQILVTPLANILVHGNHIVKRFKSPLISSFFNVEPRPLSKLNKQLPHPL